MDKIKEIFMFTLIAGSEIEEEQLLHMLAMLSDLSGISEAGDFEKGELNSTTIFIEKSLKLIKTEQYDEFIAYFKNLLLKNESYELINHLHLETIIPQDN